jgi:hypothetical protein
MRLLLDECLPRRLKRAFKGHDVSTVVERGGQGKKNGDLLATAAPFFDVLITVDKGIRYQQNLGGRDIAVLIVAARSNRYRDLVKHVPDCEAALTSLQPGQLGLRSVSRRLNSQGATLPPRTCSAARPGLPPAPPPHRRLSATWADSRKILRRKACPSRPRRLLRAS